MAFYLDEARTEELWGNIKAADADVIAASTKIATGSYVGTGTKGSGDNATRLTFNFKPMFVAVYSYDNDENNRSNYITLQEQFVYPCERGSSHGDNGQYTWHCRVVEWGENEVSWYSNGGSAGNTDAAHQQNVSGKTYYYVAIGV